MSRILISTMSLFLVGEGIILAWLGVMAWKMRQQERGGE